MAAVDKPGKRYRHKHLEFYADQGMVHIIDLSRNGLRTACSCLDFDLRAQDIGEASRIEDRPEKRRLMEKAANNMQACAAEAARQGDITDPDVHMYYARHRTYVTQFSFGVSYPPGVPGDLIASRR
jgi:hypothetical protein